MITLTTVLVATDFSDASDAAFAYGRELARHHGAALHVLHVVEDLGRQAAGFPEYGIMLDKLQAESERAARARVEALLSDEDRTQLQARAVIITAPSTAQAILSYARDERIDLIVVGTEGRSGLSRFLIGSVAERVVRGAPCPVLTVRRPEREFVRPDALQAVAHA
jgi:nucleotide-binding universal stress UspA family protein